MRRNSRINLFAWENLRAPLALISLIKCMKSVLWSPRWPPYLFYGCRVSRVATLVGWTKKKKISCEYRRQIAPIHRAAYTHTHTVCLLCECARRAADYKFACCCLSFSGAWVWGAQLPRRRTASTNASYRSIASVVVSGCSAVWIINLSLHHPARLLFRAPLFHRHLMCNAVAKHAHTISLSLWARKGTKNRGNTARLRLKQSKQIMRPTELKHMKT